MTGHIRTHRPRLAALMLALAVAAGPAAAQMSEGSHAAIAFSRSMYGVGGDVAAPGIGTSWGWANRRGAERAAVFACSRNDPLVTDCRVEVAITSGCAAVAVGTRGVSASAAAGRGASVRAASAAAVSACQRNAQGCRVAATTCARSRNRP